MSLSDSLRRVEQEGSTSEHARGLTAKYRAIIQQTFDELINKEAMRIFQLICDNIAERIHDSARKTDIHVEGFVEMPERLYLYTRQVDMEFYEENSEFFSRPRTDGYSFHRPPISSILPLLVLDYESLDTYVVPLTTSSEGRGGSFEEFFSGLTYHRRESMTQYGNQLVRLIREMAQADGISIDVAVLYVETDMRSGIVQKTEVPYNSSKTLNPRRRRYEIKRIVKYSYN